MTTCLFAQPDESRPPVSIMVGDSASWRIELSDYDPADWNGVWHFSGPAESFQIVATEDGAAFVGTLTATVSATRVPQSAKWTLTLTHATADERRTVDSGSTDLLEDPATAAPLDRRSWAERALEAVRDLIAGKPRADVSSLSVQGHQVTKMTWAELIEAERWLSARVESERQAAAICEGTGGQRRAVLLQIY